MASSADIRDIMGLSAGGRPQEVTKEMILGTDKPKKIYPKKSDTVMKRPEGMARELYNLLYNDNKDAPPLIPTGKLLLEYPKSSLDIQKETIGRYFLDLEMHFISLKYWYSFFALSDTAIGKDKSYKQMKAKLGMRKVRPWKWMPFKNPARKDDLVLYHWRRATEKGQDYAFAKFNKKLEVGDLWCSH